MTPERREQITTAVLAAACTVSAALAVTWPRRARRGSRWRSLPWPDALAVFVGPGTCGSCPGCRAAHPCVLELQERALTVALGCGHRTRPAGGLPLSTRVLLAMLGSALAWQLRPGAWRAPLPARTTGPL